MAGFSAKYLKRSPNDIVEAVRRFCRYHKLFHDYLANGGRIESSLDRGAFRRPHDLLPPEVLRMLGEEQRSSAYAYGPEAGDPTVRQKIADVENIYHGTSYTKDNVVMMPGAWAGLEFVLEEILHLEKGKIDREKVVVIGPTLYQMFHRPIRFLGIEVIGYDFVIPGTEHMPTREDMEDIFRERPRAIVISNPNNPDGKYFPAQLLKEIIDRAQVEGIYVILDEIQNCVPHNGAGSGYDSWIQKKHVIRVDSPSKRYALAEHRVGWVIADSGLLGIDGPDFYSRMEGIVGRMSGLIGNAPRAANTALLYLLDKELEKLETGSDFLQRRWEDLRAKEGYVLERLRRIQGVDSIILPDACINLTIRTEFHGSDMELAEALMKAGTLLMPASGYGYELNPATLRITFAERQERLEHSMNILQTVLDNCT